MGDAFSLMALSGQDSRYYTNLIQHSLSLQAQQKERWEQSLDFLRLRWFERRAGLLDAERTEVHYIWAYFNTLIPTLYAKNPHIFVKARQPKQLPLAQTMEDLLNYYKDELKLKPAVQSAIADTVPYGIGWVEVGYTPPTQFYRGSHKRKPSMVEQAKQSIQKLLGQPNPEERVEGQLLPDVRGGKIFLRWIPAYRVLLAPGYHSIPEMPYLIVMEDSEVEEFKSNPRYNPDVADRAQPTRMTAYRGGKVLTPQPRISKDQTARAEGDMRFIRSYHIHDRRNMRKVGFADGVSDPLYEEPWGCAFDEFSLVPLLFNDSPASEDDANAYPMDDITPLKPQLLELSLLRTSMVKQRRRGAPIILVDRDLYSEAEISLMQESEEATIIPVKGGARGFFATNPVTIPEDCFKVGGTIMQDLNLVGGFDQLMLSGQSQPGVDTATEAQMTAQGTTMRQGRKVDLIESFIVELARRMAAYALEYHEAVDVAEMLGLPAVSETMWPDLQGLDDAEKNKLIRRELMFKIEAGSTRPDQIRLIEQNLAIRNTNMIAAAFTDQIDKQKLLKYHLKKIGDKEFEYVLKPDTESSQKEAEMENRLLSQGIPQMAHRGDRHDVHIPSHGQEAQLMAQMGMDTAQLDQHTLQHQQFMQADYPKKGQAPQAGDTLSPSIAAIPEYQRSGGEDSADQLGQSAGNSVSMGPENSMTP